MAINWNAALAWLATYVEAAMPAASRGAGGNVAAVTRREHLAGISALAAHALFSEVLEAFARAAAAPPEAWRPEAVAPEQGPLLAEVVETILPATDTPGAKAARVHMFVDLALARCVPAAAGRAAVAVGAAARSAPRTSLPRPTRDGRGSPRSTPAALALLQELTVLGYFTLRDRRDAGAGLRRRSRAGTAAASTSRPGQKAWAT